MFLYLVTLVTKNRLNTFDEYLKPKFIKKIIRFFSQLIFEFTLIKFFRSLISCCNRRYRQCRTILPTAESTLILTSCTPTPSLGTLQRSIARRS